MMFTPERMARFLAFMGYPISEVQAALEQQYPDYDDAAALAAAAVEQQREAQDYDNSVLARNDKAIHSEHNL